jgi:hypothetical protein
VPKAVTTGPFDGDARKIKGTSPAEFTCRRCGARHGYVGTDMVIILAS